MAQINQLIADHRDILAILFNDYNIQAPVNVKTVSAAIIAHSNDDGNPFLEDLSQFLENEFNNYEDILGLGKKAKEKRGGGKSTGGKILGRIGGISGIFKGKTKNPTTSKAGSGVFAYSPENPAEYSELIKTANTSDPVLKSGIITDQKPNKVTTSKVLDTISDVATAASNIFSGGGSGGSGGGNEDDGSEGGNGGSDQKPSGFDLKKWALPIIGGVLVLGVIIWAVTRPKAK